MLKQKKKQEKTTWRRGIEKPWHCPGYKVEASISHDKGPTDGYQ